MNGPLAGLKVVEVGGLGPVPFACMLLADMGADVVRIERPGVPRIEGGATTRGRRVLELDLKSAEDVATLEALANAADVLVEGYRPGVMERLGLGPQALLASNPKLVYARMTGWGQSGPLAQRAGHDIDYIAITGALGAIGPAGGAPSVPLNLVGDYGGGAMYLIAGILAAVFEAGRSGRGQVVDAAICDGVLSMLSLFHRFIAENTWTDERGANVLDGGAPFYRTYECKDGRYIAVGALEPQFHAQWREAAGLHGEAFGSQNDASMWPEAHRRTEAVMRTRTRDEWMAVFEGTDACVAPVMSLHEARDHPHLRARGAFVEIDGQVQPAPAPRFSNTPSQARSSTELSSADELLREWQPRPQS